MVYEGGVQFAQGSDLDNADTRGVHTGLRWVNPKGKLSMIFGDGQPNFSGKPAGWVRQRSANSIEINPFVNGWDNRTAISRHVGASA